MEVDSIKNKIMLYLYQSNNVIVNDIKRTCSKQAKPTIQENGNTDQDLTLLFA